MKSSMLVACLCAEWCGTCRDYAATFEQAASEFGAECRFAWIDIEDQADAIGSIDVDNFPTLLIACDGQALFFGPITPQAQTLSRLVTGALQGELKAAPLTADLAALVQRFA